MNYQTLTQEEKVRLVEAIGDSVEGRQIAFDDFQELVGLFCEDIAGLECLSDEELAGLVSECWSIMNSKKTVD
jgi:hypothetical protein